MSFCGVIDRGFDLTKLEGLTWTNDIGGNRLSLSSVNTFPLILLHHFFLSSFFLVYGPFNRIIDIWSS